MKKVMVAMLLAGFLVFLAGCGSGPDPQTYPNNNGYDSPTSTPVPTTAPSANEPAVSPVSHTDNLSHKNGIPAWLLAGVEAYLLSSQTVANAAEWYEEAKTRGLPGLTDEWFIPGFIEDELTESVHAVAYTFVRHLSEIDELDNLITLYRRDADTWHDAESWSPEQVWAAEEARAKLWADFVDAEVNVQNFIFQYTFDEPYVFREREFGNITFNALAQNGWYLFVESENWTRDMAAKYVEISEESIQFVGDWLGYHHAKPLISIHEESQIAGGNFLMDSRTIWSIGVIGRTEAHIAHAHEAAHALFELSSISRSNVPSEIPDEFFVEGSGLSADGGGDGHTFAELLFEEGMCSLLMYMFQYYTQNDFLAMYGADTNVFPALAWLENALTEHEDFDGDFVDTDTLILEAYHATGGFESFEELAAFADEFLFDMFFNLDDEEAHAIAFPHNYRRATWEEHVIFLHFYAFRILTGVHRGLFAWGYDFQGALQAGVPYAALFDHQTAASFFLYLLENRGTFADLLRVYQDIHQAEAVFGYNLETLITQWRVYLDDTFAEWAQATYTPDNETEGWFDIFFDRYFEWYMEWFGANM